MTTTATTWDDWDTPADTRTPTHTATAAIGSSETTWTLDEPIRYFTTRYAGRSTRMIDGHFTSPWGDRRRFQLPTWKLFAHSATR